MYDKGLCCAGTETAESAVYVFSILAGMAVVCIAAMFVFTSLVSVISRKSYIISLSIALAYNVAVLVLLGDFAYSAMDDPLLVPLPDLGFVGFLLMLAALEVRAIGVIIQAIGGRSSANEAITGVPTTQ